MEHRYSSWMFCPICEGSMEDDDGSSVFYQRVSRNTHQQKLNFLFVWN